MTTDTENIDLTFLAKQNEKILSELAAVRREIADVRLLANANAEYSRRLDRKLTETKDDVEFILKAELSGNLNHFETRIEKKFDDKFEELRAVLLKENE